ncbi:PREDICTED: ejaculatory bulb-specific protein 3-like [Papilio xuthus]|uniref:Ejaculatory bulb-specific protein 3-like n=1 Tax=Papilio xuthus TaxID=66420 RepID=A0AAJ6Z0J2_PAPXU|nr:PREDICTED: ejaculatory bulb-specific protein 3-like [Papilio xuthus]
MKIIVLNIFILVLLYWSEGFPAPTYTTKYDNVNLDEVLASERLLTGYVNCLLDQGPCTPDGKELKQNLPDAIANDCRSCTERQREGADKVMHHIIDNRPDDWDKLEQKYKSDGSYKKQYLENKIMKSKVEGEKEQSQENEDADENDK